MPAATANLLAILDLERLEENLFRGRSPQTEHRARVFGGQVVAQALIAAERTVEARPPHSLHAYFLEAGDPASPIIYQVARLRDGGSFSARRVDAVQHGRLIFTLSAGFQKPEQGFAHSTDMPDVPDPDELADSGDFAEQLSRAPAAVRAYFQRANPIDIRPLDPSRYSSRTPRPPRQGAWFRTTETMLGDESLNRAVLAYASDMTLLDTTLVAHGRSVFASDIAGASLDHALWFHAPARADEWLLYVQDSPFAGSGRGFARGQIFTRAGLLVASVAQEGVIRRRRQEPRPLF